MSDNKMSPELQIAIRRSPEYTAPSAELVALRAEVAGWRRAVRWCKWGGGEFSYSLRVGDTAVAAVSLTHSWAALVRGVSYPGYSDRNAACAKVCELLGIPVVLP